MTYRQISPDLIQGSKVAVDGSVELKLVTRDLIQTRALECGTLENYCPWDELDYEAVDWLNMTVYEAKQKETTEVNEFKATRELSIKTKVVNANGHLFHADLWSKTQISEAIAVYVEEGYVDTDSVKWSLFGTPSGYMTDVTLADLKLARKLAQLHMSEVWSSEEN
jgi:cobyrinic acid a,c-diamide synthase